MVLDRVVEWCYNKNMEQKMYVLEVFDGNEWEQVAEWFDSVEEAESYYENQLGGFRDFRVTEEAE